MIDNPVETMLLLKHGTKDNVVNFWMSTLNHKLTIEEVVCIQDWAIVSFDGMTAVTRELNKHRTRRMHSVT